MCIFQKVRFEVSPAKPRTVCSHQYNRHPALTTLETIAAAAKRDAELCKVAEQSEIQYGQLNACIEAFIIAHPMYPRQDVNALYHSAFTPPQVSLFPFVAER